MGAGRTPAADRDLLGPGHGGKGSTIKLVTEHINPRVVRIVPGEIVLMDRSWYNRAGGCG
jgi:polyphosphate kinase 2 (PPK2 family)